MTDNNFDIKILDLHWMNDFDESTDLCAHGRVYLKIGDQIVSNMATGDWTLSSTALSLLRTIEKDYEKDEFSNPILPCCGHFFISNDNQETVIIQGCDTGIDWKIIHTHDNNIRHILDSGYEITIDKETYKRKVFEFADQVEQFYKDSKPKTIPTDDFDRKGYFAFWKEWRNLRDAGK